MAEHSRCQPGRPGPHGVGQDGSPGLAPFHSVKSRGSRLPTPADSPCCTSSRRWPDSWPYSGNELTEKYTSPASA